MKKKATWTVGKFGAIVVALVFMGVIVGAFFPKIANAKDLFFKIAGINDDEDSSDTIKKCNVDFTCKLKSDCDCKDKDGKTQECKKGQYCYNGVYGCTDSYNHYFFEKNICSSEPKCRTDASCKIANAPCQCVPKSGYGSIQLCQKDQFCDPYSGCIDNKPDISCSTAPTCKTKDELLDVVCSCKFTTQATCYDEMTDISECNEGKEFYNYANGEVCAIGQICTDNGCEIPKNIECKTSDSCNVINGPCLCSVGNTPEVCSNDKYCIPIIGCTDTNTKYTCGNLSKCKYGDTLQTDCTCEHEPYLNIRCGKPENRNDYQKENCEGKAEDFILDKFPSKSTCHEGQQCIEEEGCI